MLSILTRINAAWDQLSCEEMARAEEWVILHTSDDADPQKYISYTIDLSEYPVTLLDIHELSTEELHTLIFSYEVGITGEARQGARA